jgi:hypothetical protein
MRMGWHPRLSLSLGAPLARPVGCAALPGLRCVGSARRGPDGAGSAMQRLAGLRSRAGPVEKGPAGVRGWRDQAGLVWRGWGRAGRAAPWGWAARRRGSRQGPSQGPAGSRRGRPLPPACAPAAAGPAPPACGAPQAVGPPPPAPRSGQAAQVAQGRARACPAQLCWYRPAHTLSAPPGRPSARPGHGASGAWGGAVRWGRAVVARGLGQRKAGGAPRPWRRGSTRWQPSGLGGLRACGRERCGPRRSQTIPQGSQALGG